MRKTMPLVVPLLVICGCQREGVLGDRSQSGTDAERAQRAGLEAALLDGRAAFDVRQLLIPPARFPVNTDPIVEPADGHSVLIRSAGTGQVLNLVEVSGVTPGHVHLYEIVAFNHPARAVRHAVAQERSGRVEALVSRLIPHDQVRRFPNVTTNELRRRPATRGNAAARQLSRRL